MPQTTDNAPANFDATEKRQAKPSQARLPSALLRDVSRSFYLTLRVLPGAIRQQIGLAYLLARTTDTIADTDVVPVAERLAALDQLRAGILGHSTAPLDFTPFLRAPGSGEAQAVSDGAKASRNARPAGAAQTGAERALLEHIGEALSLLASFAPEDQRLIRGVLSTITSGQELDLRRFGGTTPAQILALDTDAELDDYTYRVAGCVGEFWTRMCRAHLFPAAPLDEAWLLAKSVRFGKGLQLVNVLRDLPRDLRQGRCYLPRQQLAAHQLAPGDLLERANLGRLRPLYDAYLDLAEACLADGWAYTNALPRQQARVRLACAWPILIGVKTLARLRTGDVLDPRQILKISRAEVRNLMLCSVLLLPWRGAWERLFDKARWSG
jgi:farnesyl-diphosphate farnesyltransferase